MDEQQGFRVDVTQGAAGVRVAPVGELDVATADRLRTALELDEHQVAVVVLDLRGVEFMDSSGLALIISQRRSAERRGARFAVVPGDVPAVLRILELSGLLPALDVVADPAEALGPD